MKDDTSVMIEVEVSDNTKEKPYLPHAGTSKITMTFMSHACLLFESKECTFMTDPWIENFAFQSWFPSFAPPEHWDEIVNDCCDFIYISHNHNDHLNEHTLKKIRKDMLFAVPNFNSESVVRPLQSQGFEHINALDFNKVYQPCRGSGHKVRPSNIYLQVMQSGDGRDDSGLYFTCGNFSFLTQVDSIDLNNNHYPDYCTVFASSFAGGASSYPLCFDTVDNKAEVVDTLLKEVKSDVIKAVKKVMPKYFLPYAGFATPILAQDKFIKDNDKLLTPDDYTRTIGRTLVDVLDVRKADTFVFDGGNLLETSQIKRERASTVQQAEQLYERRHRDIISANEVIQYFIHSAYRDELIVYLELTDPHFNPLVGISYEGNNLLKFIIDFTHPLSCIQKDFDFKTEKKKQKKERMLHLKIRADAATPVLRKRMPLDDLLIGYHCRIDREPDVYNKKFWHHFTNIYIS